MIHFREECEHGLVASQCRCKSLDKTVRKIDCAQVVNHDAKLEARTAEHQFIPPAGRTDLPQ